MDIGANIGHYSFSVAGQYSGIQAFAFEPNPIMYEYLCKNIGLNNQNVVPDSRAVCNNSGPVDFYISTDRGSSSMTESNASRHGINKKIKVQGVKLDAIQGIPEPDIIKIDAEGQMLDIIQGGKELIQDSKPCIYFESHSGYDGIQYTLDECIDVFTSLGYQVTEEGRHHKATPVS